MLKKILVIVLLPCILIIAAKITIFKGASDTETIELVTEEDPQGLNVLVAKDDLTRGVALDETNTEESQQVISPDVQEQVVTSLPENSILSENIESQEPITEEVLKTIKDRDYLEIKASGKSVLNLTHLDQHTNDGKLKLTVIDEEGIDTNSKIDVFAIRLIDSTGNTYDKEKVISKVLDNENVLWYGTLPEQTSGNEDEAVDAQSDRPVENNSEQETKLFNDKSLIVSLDEKDLINYLLINKYAEDIFVVKHRSRTLDQVYLKNLFKPVVKKKRTIKQLR